MTKWKVFSLGKFPGRTSFLCGLSGAPHRKEQSTRIKGLRWISVAMTFLLGAINNEGGIRGAAVGTHRSDNNQRKRREAAKPCQTITGRHTQLWLKLIFSSLPSQERELFRNACLINWVGPVVWAVHSHLMTRVWQPPCHRNRETLW